MFMYSNRLHTSSPKPATITCCLVVPPEKITHKASNVAETCNYNALFSSSVRDCHARRIYRRTFRE